MFKGYFKKNNSNKGFTLVELLIVITIIGILAVGVMAAIDPIEQFDKATDSTMKTSAGEIVNAVERYYANNGYFPWNDSTAGDADTDGRASLNDAYYSDVGDEDNTDGAAFEAGALKAMIDQHELKASFAKKKPFRNSGLSEYDKLYVVKDVNSTDTRVCFAPRSKSMVKKMFDAGTLYLATDVQNTTDGSFPSGVTDWDAVDNNSGADYWTCMPE